MWNDVSLPRIQRWAAQLRRSPLLHPKLYDFSPCVCSGKFEKRKSKYFSTITLI